MTHINTATMKHFCNVTIHPDKLNPTGLVKRGVKIGIHEFNRGKMNLKRTLTFIVYFIAS